MRAKLLPHRLAEFFFFFADWDLGCNDWCVCTRMYVQVRIGFDMDKDSCMIPASGYYLSNARVKHI